MNTHEGAGANQTPFTEEKIVSAAIKYGEKIVTGTWHGDAQDKATKEDPDFLDEAVPKVDGFITSTGRFVDRTTALEIAEKHTQLVADENRFDFDELITEDLQKDKGH